MQAAPTSRVVDPFRWKSGWLREIANAQTVFLHFKTVKLIVRSTRTEEKLTIFGVGSAEVRASQICIHLSGPAPKAFDPFDCRLEVYASDTDNRIYCFDLKVTHLRSTEETFHLSGETQRIQVQQNNRIRPTEGPAQFKIALPKEYVFPFSKVESSTSLYDGKVLEKKDHHSGYYGQSKMFDINVDQDHDLTFVEIDCKHTSSPLNDWDCAEESLEYVLGLPLNSVYSSMWMGHEEVALIRTHQPFIYPGQGSSPIDIRLGSDEFMLLFESFFNYSKSNTSTNCRSSLYSITNNVYSAAFSYTFVQIVNLCFAIEWLAQNLTPDSLPGCLSKDRYKDLIKAVKGVELTQLEKNRVLGLMSLSKTPSTKQRLRFIMEQGHVSQHQLEIWDSFRHKAAHGGVIEDGRISLTVPRLELLQMFHSLVALLLTKGLKP